MLPIDLLNENKYLNCFGDTFYDVVICCAVVYSPELSVSLDNVRMTTNIVEFFTSRCKSLIFVSSLSAIEENKYQDSYNLSKYLSEKVIEYHQQQGVDNLCTLRFAQIFDQAYRGKLVQKGFYYFVDSVNNNKPFSVFVKDDKYRSYISVEQLCEIIAYAIEKKIVGFHNIVYKPLLTLRELANLLKNTSSSFQEEVTFEEEKSAIAYYIPESSPYFEKITSRKDMTEDIKKMIKK